MANLILNVTIGDVDVPLLAAGFLRKCPMPQIPDPEDPTKTIDKFLTTKEWAEDWLEDKILRAANFGIDELQTDLSQKLTKDIFIQE